MRTNIDIDDDLMARAMAAGPFKTKKEAVEAGLALLERQAAYREILKWKGKLQWGWDDGEPRLDGQPNIVQAAEPPATYRAKAATTPAAKAVKHGRR
ncbi:type II toxin-antitoxin system VapB family antitoxin [Roseateles sp. DC23W]|uniref:Type II toxin-antitoxin system VapB family antitoxin n=1 Tax=Pelomonas dachongensis TaxID=3299029 RepID=A0ABW7ETR2_9BURK